MPAGWGTVVGASSPDRWPHNQSRSPRERCRSGLAPALKRSSSAGRLRGGGSPTGSLRSRGCCEWAQVSGWSRVLRPATGASVEMTALLGVRACSGRGLGAAFLGPSAAATAGQAALLLARPLLRRLDRRRFWVCGPAPGRARRRFSWPVHCGDAWTGGASGCARVVWRGLGAAALGPPTATPGQGTSVVVQACSGARRVGRLKLGRSGCEPPAKVRSPKPRRHLDRAFMAFGAPAA